MRRWLVLAAGVPAGLVLPRLLGLGASDALRGTVAVLPAAAALFVLLDDVAISTGARQRGRPGRADLVAVIIWLTAVAARGPFGLDGADAVLAATLFAGLGVRIAGRLVAWRPVLGTRLPARPSALFFFLPLTVYFSILPWCIAQRPPDGDEPHYLLLTHSLAYDFDVDLTDNYARGDASRFLDRPLEPQPGDPVGPDGRQYSRHAPLLPLVLAPFYRVGGALGAQLAMIALTALLAWWTLRLARHFDLPPGPTLLSWALFSLFPPLLLYSHQIWIEVPAALLLVMILDTLADDRSRRWTLIPLLALPLLKLRFLALAVPAAVWGWWRGGRRPGELAAGTGALLLAGGAVAVHNLMRFGNALKIHTGADFAAPGATAWATAMTGLFFDVAFGLFAAAPLWAILVVVPLRRRLRTVLGLIAVAAPYLAVVATRTEWYGGWSPSFRYGIPVLPLLALATVPAFADRRTAGARVVLAALVSVSAALTLLWLAVPGWTYDLAGGSQHLLDLLAAHLGADVIRVFPSTVRPRLATWLWPLLAMVVLPATWLGWRHRWRPAVTIGFALALLSPAFVVAAARTAPTRLAEVEDPWVRKLGGWLYPAKWTVNRVRFRGGWTLPEGASLEIPVVPGGRRLRSVVHVRFDRLTPHPAGLQIWVGDQLVRVWRPDDADNGVWRAIRVPELDWPDGESLRIVTHAPQRPRRRSMFLVDRVEMTWRE